MDTPVELIVGLGNPGPTYEMTRHNVGADLVVSLATSHKAQFKLETKFFGYTTKIILDKKSIRLLIPNTFMNLSGKSLGALVHFYQIPPEKILVVHDELDLSPGVARFKKGGGHGGHNGLRDIIKSLGNNSDFARLRIGIGHPGNARKVADYVLKKAPPNEQELINISIVESLHALPLAILGSWERAMTKLHSND